MTRPSRWRLAALPLALLVAGCAGTAGRPDSSSGPLPDKAPPPMARVAESFVTAPMPRHEIDSVAAWNTPDGGTWLIATGKETHQLVVYDGNTGAMLREIGGQGDAPGQFLRPNGIAVFGDILFVVERDNQRVQLFELPSFRPLLQFGKGELKSPYGLWLHELAPRELELLVTDSFMADYRTQLAPPLDELDQRVKRYRLDLRGATPSATLVEQFGDTSEKGALRMVESIAGDPVHDRLLIAEEDIRIGTTLREYRMDGTYTGRSLPPERFQAQAEGVALWACDDGSGYWITADQNPERTAFHVFDRESLVFKGSFAGDQVAVTDGIWLHAVGTQAFPNGVLYVSHNDEGAGAFDWREIARALDLRVDCTTP
ncbi:phytase [Arenimonas sp.]|uniref:phytase n=1 Tax=Arenimonas sp. TaxID=1872635 RepID=UPI002E366AC3|nr:phytase [Arenimonas sp.]HEX4854392.1 phytase [Arenimonas sp.]